MSKLKELINELCPNGVEYTALGKIGELYGGLSGKSKEDFSDGNAAFITYMNVFSNISITKNAQNLKVKVAINERQNIVLYGDVLFTGSSETLNECGMSSVMCYETNEPFYLNSFCFGLRLHDTNLFLPEFSKYLFRSCELRKQIIQTASGVTRFNISKKKMGNLLIPIPPLPIQREIVRILDTFTELTAELEAELEARKKQYEYYRDTLLTFGDEVPMVMLHEVSIMIRGTYVTKKNTVEGDIPVILGGQEPAYYCDTHNHDGEAIVMSRSGAYAGFVSFWNQPIFVTDGFILEAKDELNLKYLYYFLKNMQNELHGMKRGGGVPHVRGTEIMEIKIPIPPLAEQERIVAILDRFDALTHDLSTGLPAEIAARKQQYEYYRDQLLTFKEVSP